MKMKKQDWFVVGGALLVVLLLVVFAKGMGLLAVTPTTGTVVGAATVYAGQPYTAAISMNSPVAPDADYSDGSVARVYGGVSVVDSSNNYLFKSPVQELSSTAYSYNLQYTPAATGKIFVVGILSSSSSTFNYATGTWSSWTPLAQVSSAQKSVDVITPGAPAEPTFDFWAGVSSFISGIVCSIKQLFGMAC